VVWGPCILAAQFLTTTGNTLSWKTIVVLFGAWGIPRWRSSYDQAATRNGAARDSD
jgi:hypothetical protein